MLDVSEFVRGEFAMAGRSGKIEKGKRTGLGRGRKTGDWLLDTTTPTIAGRIEKQRTDAVASDSNRFQRVTIQTGNNPGGHFRLALGNDSTEDIDWDAKHQFVRNRLKQDIDGVGLVVSHGGPLDEHPVEIEFKTTLTLPRMTVTKQPTQATASVDTIESNERRWSWSELANWSDLNSNRPIMEVGGGMSLSADISGTWMLTYTPTLYTYRHKWIYKLHAYAGDELLFRLVIPSYFQVNKLMPGTTGPSIIHEGRSAALAEVYGDIENWVRIGVGEYWD